MARHCLHRRNTARRSGLTDKVYEFSLISQSLTEIRASSARTAPIAFIFLITPPPPPLPGASTIALLPIHKYSRARSYLNSPRLRFLLVFPLRLSHRLRTSITERTSSRLRARVNAPNYTPRLLHESTTANPKPPRSTGRSPEPDTPSESRLGLFDTRKKIKINIFK